MNENTPDEGISIENERQNLQKNPMPKYLGLFLFAGLFLGWAIDFLFWQIKPGISITIWLVLALAVLFLLSNLEKVKAHKASYGLGGLVLLATIFYTVRAEPLTAFANVVAALFGLILLAGTFTNGNWLFYRLVHYIGLVLSTIFGGLSRPFTVMAKVFGETTADGKKSTGKVLLAVIRGLVITIPILVLLGSLLAAADAVFEGVMGDILNWFLIDDLGEYIFRFVYVVIFSVIFMGVLFQALVPKGVAKRPDPNKEVVNPFLGWIETVMIFGGINIMFLIFVVIQFNYLFGGERNIHKYMTYSTYARQGFGELIAVAVISLMIYLALASVSRKKSETRRNIFSGLSVLLIVQVLVILVSSFKRLGLYETVYGFTRLRMYTHVFIICLAVLLVAVIALEILRIRGRFALAFLGFCFLFSFSLAVVNVDAQITRLNIIHSTRITHSSATRSGTVLDYEYLTSLSSDSMPQLVKMYANPDLPVNSHDKIGAVLMCRLFEFEEQGGANWRSFMVSDAIAEGRLVDMKSELEEVYMIERDNRSVNVLTENKKWHCQGYWD